MKIGKLLLSVSLVTLGVCYLKKHQEVMNKMMKPVKKWFNQCGMC